MAPRALRQKAFCSIGSNHTMATDAFTCSFLSSPAISFPSPVPLPNLLEDPFKQERLCPEEVMDLMPCSHGKLKADSKGLLPTSNSTASIRSSLKAARRRASRNQRERTRVKAVARGLDVLQSLIWREEVTANEERRPRLAILRRGAEYISLLTSVLQETASEELSVEVNEFVSVRDEDGQGQTHDRAERLRRILTRHSKESQTDSEADGADEGEGATKDQLGSQADVLATTHEYLHENAFADYNAVWRDKIGLPTIPQTCYLAQPSQFMPPIYSSGFVKTEHEY